jgi:hypothetical protein
MKYGNHSGKKMLPCCRYRYNIPMSYHEPDYEFVWPRMEDAKLASPEWPKPIVVTSWSDPVQIIVSKGK